MTEVRCKVLLVKVISSAQRPMIRGAKAPHFLETAAVWQLEEGCVFGVEGRRKGWCSEGHREGLGLLRGIGRA
jgi:hypothetical protein